LGAGLETGAGRAAGLAADADLAVGAALAAVAGLVLGEGLLALALGAAGFFAVAADFEDFIVFLLGVDPLVLFDLATECVSFRYLSAHRLTV
jgi:hypothetical protein